MKRTHLIDATLSPALGKIDASAYEVWTGARLMRSSDATKTSDWDLRASSSSSIGATIPPRTQRRLVRPDIVRP
ncbi:hypothetical protein [Haloferula rosea]|uniref:Uncharacterized protein n=1 Tax=Haloferula rosea TaxID=490093 RepID=A0A934R932_9BACT|nr:hypothetical protein [Haloferula rosea]MBK1826582.1 hypothetical protein [Haloferula rosea]